MRDAELLVVGAGPAGSALAALASARGVRVLAIDRDRFPRDKVCGEFVSPEGCAVLDRLGLLDALHASGATAMDSCLLADARGRSATAPLPEIPGAGRAAVGISRRVMDERLVRHAASCGVDIREGTTVVEPVVEDGLVRGVVVRNPSGAHERLQATLVVGADGRRSALQRALAPGAGDPLRTTASSWFGLQAHLPDATRGLGGRIELHVFDGGYAGLGPIEGGRLNLALIATVRALRACGGSPDRLMEERLLSNPLLAERVGGARPIAGWTTVGPLRFGARRTSSQGAIFVGDAAGTIDPFSGEGMSHALVGAERALPIVLDALDAGGWNGDAAALWDAAWRRSFGAATRRARWVGRLFERATPASWAMSVLLLPAGARALPRLVAATRTGWLAARSPSSSLPS